MVPDGGDSGVGLRERKWGELSNGNVWDRVKKKVKLNLNFQEPEKKNKKQENL